MIAQSPMSHVFYFELQAAIEDVMVPHFKAEHETALQTALTQFASQLTLIRCPFMKDCANVFLPTILDDPAALQKLTEVVHEDEAFQTLKQLAMVTSCSSGERIASSVRA